MQYISGLILLLAGACIAALNLYTTWLCLRHYRSGSISKTKSSKSPPVSILKPLKGADNGLDGNLESFFALDYPEYELIFSVAEASDPAYALACALIERHLASPARQNVTAQIIVGDVEAGPNPKVNNLIRSYAAAKHDLVLISDSNIRVDSRYLSRCVELMTPGVGCVTATVGGQDALGLGGRLEATYLNTFYARWMVAANCFGFPTVMGKSMLFSKSTAARFGGIQNLSRYLAEDYITGQAMHHLGLKCKVMNDPVPQMIGRISFKTFWQRQVRWGRMRKNMQLFAWAGELFSGPIGSALLGSLGLELLTGSVPYSLLAAHFALWFFCDLLLMKRLKAQIDAAVPFYWIAREALFIPMWVHILCGNTVLWRGNRLRLEAGGVLAEGMTTAASVKNTESKGIA
jgi:ceramide glucosyltransferase